MLISESVMDRDIRLVSERGFLAFYDEIVRAQLSETFWGPRGRLRIQSTRPEFSEVRDYVL